MEAIDTEYVLATGDSGVLFYDGKTWSKSEDLRENSFTRITASDNYHIWAIGKGGIYLGTPAE